MLKVVSFSICIVFTGVFTFLATNKLEHRTLPQQQYFSHFFSGEICFSQECLSNAVSCRNDEHKQHCPANSKNAAIPTTQTNGFYWVNYPEYNSSAFLTTNQIIKKKVKQTKSQFSCTTDFTQKVASFETIYGQPIQSVVNSFANPDRKRMHVINDAYIVENQNLQIGFKIQPLKKDNDVLRLSFKGIKIEDRQYKHALIYGQNHKGSGSVKFKLIENMGITRSLVKGADYYILLASLDHAAVNHLKYNSNSEMPVYLGDSLIELKLTQKNDKCSINIYQLTTQEYRKESNDKNDIVKTNRLILLGESNNQLSIEQFSFKQDKVNFAAGIIKPEEYLLFKQATKADVIFPTIIPLNDHPNPMVKLDLLPVDTYECLESNRHCLGERIIPNELANQRQLNLLHYKPVGSKVRSEMQLANQRLINGGIYFSKPQIAAHDNFLQGERLTAQDVTVRACKNTQCINMPLNRTTTKHEPNLQKILGFSHSDYHRIPFENNLTAFSKIEYHFNRIPNDGDSVFIVAQDTGVTLHRLNGKRRTKKCKLKPEENYVNGKDRVALYSLTQVLKQCNLDKRLNKTQSIVFTTPPLYCADPSDCHLYKNSHQLAIVAKEENSGNLRWRLTTAHSGFGPATVNPKVANIQSQNKPVSVPPDISIYTNNKQNETTTVYDSAVGIIASGKALGLTNLLGYSEHYKNHLGNYQNQPTLQLSLRQDLQNLVNDTIEQRIDRWTGTNNDADSTFRYYFGKNGQHSTANLSAVILNATTGDILAAADSNAYLMKMFNSNKRIVDIENSRPEKSPMRWLNSYHNAAFYDTPGSVFKLVTSLSMLRFKANLDLICNSKYPETKSNANKKCKEFSNQPYGQYIAGVSSSNKIFKVAEKSHFFFIDKCHYPYRKFGSTFPSYLNTTSAQQGIYRQTIHNYKSKGTCAPISAEKDIGLSSNIKHSVNTWFAWMHEMITPALLYSGEGTELGQYINKPRKDHNEKRNTHGLLGLNAEKTILSQLIPNASVLSELKYDVPIDLMTGKPMTNWQGVVHPTKSWILSPLVVKYSDLNNREALRRFAIGVGHVAMTPLHAAALTASISQHKTIYPRLTSQLQADNQTTKVNDFTIEKTKDLISSLTVSPIISGMYRAANERDGTSNNTFTGMLRNLCNGKKCLCVYAKTGSSPINTGTPKSQNSWIAGWFFLNTKAGDSYEKCPLSQSIKDLKTPIFSFACAAKRVDPAITGAKGCGRIIKDIITKGYKDNLWTS